MSSVCKRLLAVAKTRIEAKKITRKAGTQLSMKKRALRRVNKTIK